jgi:hypothetical protein
MRDRLRPHPIQQLTDGTMRLANRSAVIGRT